MASWRESLARIAARRLAGIRDEVYDAFVDEFQKSPLHKSREPGTGDAWGGTSTGSSDVDITNAEKNKSPKEVDPRLPSGVPEPEFKSLLYDPYVMTEQVGYKDRYSPFDACFDGLEDPDRPSHPYD